MDLPPGASPLRCTFDIVAASPHLFAMPNASEPRALQVLAGERGLDELDEPEFDPVAYINSRFPDEDSLADLDSFVARLEVDIRDLDTRMLDSVKTQAVAGAQAARDVDDAKSSIAELFRTVQDIKKKAEASETMVEEICADIRQLDTAKRHLTTTIATIQHLNMLVTGVDRLQEYADRRQYEDAAQLLDAVTQLFTHFEDYEDVPKIDELTETVAQIKRSLRRQIFEDFDTLTEISAQESADSDDDGPDSSSLEILRHACAVVDALPLDVRQALTRQFCAKQLRRYESTFSGEEGQDLDAVRRRYAWFRRTLRDVELRFVPVLPDHWNIPHRLCVAFAEATRDAIMSILNQYDSPDAAPAEPLVRALTHTLAFEAEMAARFERRETEETDPSLLVDDEGEAIDATSAEGIKRKYRARARSAARRASMEAGSPAAGRREWLASLAKDGTVRRPGMGSGSGSGAEEEELAQLKGLISKVFEPYLSAYVKLERETLDGLLGDARRGTDAVDRDGMVPMFETANRLFLNIKACMKRCTQLNTGQTLFSLYREFKTVLAAYAELLQNGLPSSSSSHFPGDTYVIKPEVAEQVCVTINTADYCANTIEMLQEQLSLKLDAAFRDHVDMEDESEAFFTAVAVSLKVLAAGVACMLDVALNKMSKTNWGAITSTADQSAFVVDPDGKGGDIQGTLAEVMPLVRQALNEQYFSNFCDKFARAFLPRYVEAIYRCKKVGEYGGQQLLLDAHAIKSILLSAPTMGSAAVDDDDAPSHRLYEKYVSREMGKVELLLKVVSTPKDMFADNLKALMPDATREEVQRMMVLKGFKKSEMADTTAAIGGSGASGGAGAATASAAAKTAFGGLGLKASSFWKKK